MIRGNGWDLLTPEQARASARLLDDERTRRDHLVVSLSGAHAYGFPSPDSDVDLKSVHIAPTARLVGLETDTSSSSRMEWIDGVEIDYTSNEIGGVLHAVLKGNGNYLERLVGATPIESHERLLSLQPLVLATLSRRFHRHYRGFAQSQVKAFDEKPTAKRLLYVLRTALTGSHLLRTGMLVIDVRSLLDDYGFAEARDLIAAKARGEQTVLAQDDIEAWRHVIVRAFETLDRALDASPLPEEPTAANVRDLEAWLIELRRERF